MLGHTSLLVRQHCVLCSGLETRHLNQSTDRGVSRVKYDTHGLTYLGLELSSSGTYSAWQQGGSVLHNSNVTPLDVNLAGVKCLCSAFRVR